MLLSFKTEGSLNSVKEFAVNPETVTKLFYHYVQEKWFVNVNQQAFVAKDEDQAKDWYVQILDENHRMAEKKIRHNEQQKILRLLEVVKSNGGSMEELMLKIESGQY